MYRESNNDLTIILQNRTICDTIIAWLKKAEQEAKDTHEAALHSALFDDSKMDRARITYGYHTAILDLLAEVQDTADKINRSA